MISFFKQRSLSIILLLIIFTLFIIVFFSIDNYGVSEIIAQNNSISLFINDHKYFSYFLAFSILVIGISFMVPITPIVLLIGYYYGTCSSIYICLSGQFIGSLLVYLYSRYIFYSFMKNMYYYRFENYRLRFNENSFYYLILLRIIGGIPFTVQCIICGIFKMDIKSYSLATFLGVIPYIYIFSSIGNNFNNIDDLKSFSILEILTFEYLSPIVLLVMIIFLPKIYKLFASK